MCSLVLLLSDMGTVKLPLHVPKGIYPPHTNFQTAFCEFSFIVFYCVYFTPIKLMCITKPYFSL